MKTHMWTHEMDKKRERLAESLGLKKGQGHMAVNDRTHGLNILEKSGLSRETQRQLQRTSGKWRTQKITSGVIWSWRPSTGTTGKSTLVSA